MAQVPYLPVPSVAPTEQGVPAVRPDAPPAAFGTNIAEAASGLGRATGEAGNELFARAMAFQQLNNETSAKNANIDFMLKAGDLHAKYNALQGQDRVAAFPKYSQDLQQLYTTSRGSLGNPMAQRIFDASAVSVMSRSIFSGAAAAGDAQREGALSASNAQQKVLIDNVYSTPQDQGAVDAAVTENERSAATRAALSPGGYSPEREEMLRRTGNSEIYYNQVMSLARNKPEQAMRMLEDYKNRGVIFGPQAEQATNKVQSYTHTVGMEQVADQITSKYLSPDGTFTKSSTQMQEEAKSLAVKTYPDDPAIATAAVQAVDRKIYMHNFAATQDRNAVTQEVNDNIVKGVTTTSMLPPDLVQRMTPTQLKAFPGQANAYQASIAKQTDQEQYQKLLGLYNNDNGKFMDTNLYAQPGLSKANIDFFVGLQRKAAANGDPRVGRAMGWLKGAVPQALDDLGVTGKAKDPDTANQFVGALHEAIQSYQETNGKPPDEKTLTKEIYPLVTRQITQKGWLWNSQENFFKAPVPDDYRNEYLKAVPNASDEQIHTDYNRQMFDHFFKTQAASKNQERVPQ